MSTLDKRVDSYIEAAADFARPVLHHLRELMHRYCPLVTETIKWSFPHFAYRGKILFSMAAFRAHCSCGFWLEQLMQDPYDLLNKVSRSGMGSFGKITSISDLPEPGKMAFYIKEAMRLVDAGVTRPAASVKTPEEQNMPEDVMAALRKNKRALEQFQQFAPSHRREYLQWINEAKRATTRSQRIATMLEWLADGKSRNWKYEKQ